MNDDTTTPIARRAPVADEPVGTPPAGGSWSWVDGAWHRNDDVEQTRHVEPAQED